MVMMVMLVVEGSVNWGVNMSSSIDTKEASRTLLASTAVESCSGPSVSLVGTLLST